MIDSERLYTVATNAVLAPYGKEMTWEIKAKLMGRPAHDAAARLIEETGVPLSVDELLTTMDAKLDGLFRSVQPLPGVVKLVRHLEKHQVPMAVRPQPLPARPPAPRRARSPRTPRSSRRSRRARSARTLTSRARTSSTCSARSRARSCAATTPSSKVRASPTRPSLSRRPRCSTSSASSSLSPRCCSSGTDALRGSTPEDRAQVLVFEDGVSGVQAARAARSRVDPGPRAARLARRAQSRAVAPARDHGGL